MQRRDHTSTVSDDACPLYRYTLPVFIHDDSGFKGMRDQRDYARDINTVQRSYELRLHVAGSVPRRTHNMGNLSSRDSPRRTDTVVYQLRCHMRYQRNLYDTISVNTRRH